MARIVVGVDGSEESRAALRWALEEARLRGAALTAVYAWSYPMVPGRGIAPAALAVPAGVLRQEAEELVESAAAEVGGEEAGVTLRCVAVEGPPTDVLVEASKDADLLVVGSHGRGDVAGLLLGSVSRHCAHHAWCPVVIVRAGVPPSRG